MSLTARWLTPFTGVTRVRLSPVGGNALRPTDIIFLTRRDTIDTACSLLRRARTGGRVWMVIPWRAAMARDLINLKRLKRVAEDGAMDLSLVSRHLETRALAQEAGLAVSFFVPWHLKKYRPREVRTADLGPRVVPADDATLPERVRRSPKRFTLARGLLSLILISVLLVALFGVVLVFLPTARVILEPVSASEEVVFTARTNPRYRQVGYEEAVIPSRSIQVIVEGRGDTPATGRRDVAEQHASGFVVLSNRTDQPLTVPRGTIVRTSSGTTVRFYTTADAELPDSLHAHVRVPVIAIDPGYVLVQPFTLNRMEGEFAARVEVLNDSRIEGGTTRRVPTVAYNDLDTLRSLLVQELQAEAYERFVEALEPGEFVPVSSVQMEVISLDYDQVVDEQTDLLSGRMQMVVRGTAIQEGDIRDLARWLLVEQFGSEGQVVEDSLVLMRSQDVRLVDDWMELDVRAQGLIAPVIDMGMVRRAIQGREADQAVAWLSDNLSLQRPPEVSITPSEWQRLPVLAERLEIVISASP